MFTGLIQAIGVVKSVEDFGSGKRFEIKTPLDHSHFSIGASIACAGACMTVVEFRKTNCGQTRFKVDVSSESLAKTTLRQWDVERHINLEASLRPSDPMGGHIVSGHVDGVAEVVKIIPHENFTEFHIHPPAELARYVATKGSVTLDGTSLTVNEILNLPASRSDAHEQREARSEGGRGGASPHNINDFTFTLMLIPHTLEVTTWGRVRVGDRLNMEVDMLARYVERLMTKTED